MVKAKAPRNKTLELSPKEIALYASKAVKLSQKSNLTDVINRVIRQDSFKALDLLPDGCIDLMIVDPPYNLTKNFGKSTFKEMDFDAYKKWLDKWLKKTVRLLKDNASIYIYADWKTSICIPEAAGKYFDDIECFGATGLSKGENNKLIIERNNIISSVYVGDTQGDADSATVAGIPFVYARYGFGDVEKYDYVIDKISDMIKIM